MVQSTLRWGGLNMGLVLSAGSGSLARVTPLFHVVVSAFVLIIFFGRNFQWQRSATLRQTDHLTRFRQGHKELFLQV